MSFLIYHCDGVRYARVDSIKLTGADGVLARFLMQNSHVETPFAWQLSDADIIQLARPDLNPTEHRLILDMMPGDSHEISLYHVTYLQGSSELDESDVVLASRILFQATEPGAAVALKRAFTLDKPESSRQMLEAMRLTGGTLRGKYFWAKPKMDIGAAVCPSSTSVHENTQPLVEA